MTTGSPVVTHAPADAWRHAVRLAASLEHYIAQLRASLQLSSNEMNVLLLLHDGGACAMTELSHRVRLTRPALTSLVDRLEAAGWLTRSGDAGDRRRVIVSLTSKFEEQFLAASHDWRQRLQNHASADPAGWSRLRGDIDAICRIAERSAIELRTPIRRPAR